MKKFLPLTIVFFILAAGVLVTAPALQVQAADAKEMAAPAVDMEAAKTVFEEACSKCHALSRPLGKKKDQAGWVSTVERMSSYHERKLGKAIPAEDQTAIVQYLLSAAGK